jgi:hypothetical protein
LLQAKVDIALLLAAPEPALETEPGAQPVSDSAGAPGADTEAALAMAAAAANIYSRLMVLLETPDNGAAPDSRSAVGTALVVLGRAVLALPSGPDLQLAKDCVLASQLPSSPPFLRLNNKVCWSYLETNGGADFLLWQLLYLQTRALGATSVTERLNAILGYMT